MNQPTRHLIAIAAMIAGGFSLYWMVALSTHAGSEELKPAKLEPVSGSIAHDSTRPAIAFAAKDVVMTRDGIDYVLSIAPGKLVIDKEDAEEVVWALEVLKKQTEVLSYNLVDAVYRTPAAELRHQAAILEERQRDHDKAAGVLAKWQKRLAELNSSKP